MEKIFLHDKCIHQWMTEHVVFLDLDFNNSYYDFGVLSRTKIERKVQQNVGRQLDFLNSLFGQFTWPWLSRGMKVIGDHFNGARTPDNK